MKQKKTRHLHPLRSNSLSLFHPLYFFLIKKTGSKSRKGPSESIPAAAPKFGRNYRAPNIKDMKKDAEPKKKNFFGLF